MAGVTVTLELEAEEFQTLRNELRESEDKLRAEYNELTRVHTETGPPSIRSPADSAVYVDRTRRISKLSDRLASLQALIEDLG